MERKYFGLSKYVESKIADYFKPRKQDDYNETGRPLIHQNCPQTKANWYASLAFSLRLIFRKAGIPSPKSPRTQNTG